MTHELILQLLVPLLLVMLILIVRLKSKNDELSSLLKAVQETRDADVDKIYTLLLNIENEVSFLEAALNKDC